MSGRSTPQEAWSEWGGDGPQLVFAHANGFPPATYRVFLQELSRQFRANAFAARPLWPGCDPSEAESWRDLAGDLRRAMGQRGLSQVVGVGHSLGGVLSIMTAAADPSLFRALALVDPVVFSGLHVLYWGGLKNLGFSHRLPLIRSARRRRDRFPDIEAVRSAYAGKSVFSTWAPDVLEDYVQAAFNDTEDGEVVLRYSKAWESRIFEMTPASVWPDIRRLTVPVLVIRGASSDTFLPGAANKIQRELPSATVIELPDTTHFLPMEQPAAVAETIIEWHQNIAENV
ncbi:MAG: alpha/beta hydrolase [Thermoanaerobaculales bacterium]|nr:alpha/beta hydrolase [Thermoanaerobaculales bacterium]